MSRICLKSQSAIELSLGQATSSHLVLKNSPKSTLKSGKFCKVLLRSALVSRFSLTAFCDSLPEVIVSHAAISKRISLAAKAGLLRRIASRLYTRNLTDSPETLVRRNLWSIVAGYFPGGLVADRTALENGPSQGGSICLVSERGATVRLPGVTL